MESERLKDHVIHSWRDQNEDKRMVSSVVCLTANIYQLAESQPEQCLMTNYFFIFQRELTSREEEQR